ncbi:unnamed protein product, partial [Mesorhabditis spiculigera]
MKEEHGPTIAALSMLQLPQLPGSWFYEVGGSDDSSTSPSQTGDDDLAAAFGNGMKSMLNARTITETVEVPSSEHVAEIVGRQGCKIKALRAKTNTYIKTPVRGEEPVFMITGRSEDVIEAKREIECAAEHFTQIRASRRHSQGGAPAPGHVTAYVRVPLRVVGLVVGPKGATIKRIQQDTHTYIITPSREREPIFEVTGLPQNVEAARKEIEQHIYQRTGNMPITDPHAPLSNYNELQNTTNPSIGYSSLSAAASVAARSSYGSLAATSALRRQEINSHDFSRQQQQQEYFGNRSMMPMMMPQNPHSQQLSVAIGPYGPNKMLGASSPFSAAPQPPNMQSALGNNTFGGNASQQYRQWSSAYFDSENQAPGLFGQNIGSVQQALGSLSLSTNGYKTRPTWPPVAANMTNEEPLPSFVTQRDEGLGDSPPSLSVDSYHLMSSIWSELDTPKEYPMASRCSGLAAAAAPFDAHTAYSSGISQ